MKKADEVYLNEARKTLRKHGVNDLKMQDFNRQYGTVEQCMAVMETIRWNGKPFSPFTHSYNVARSITKNPKKACLKYMWRDCTNNKKFTVLHGTPFAHSHVPINVWFKMIWYICVTSDSISSFSYASLLGVTQKTAWFMHQRIMECLAQDESMIFEGVVEVDETFYGGSDKWRPDYKKSNMLENGDGKQPILGIVERGTGKTMMKVVPDVSASTLLPEIIAHTTDDTVVYSDDHKPYNQLGKVCKHESVCHSAGEFVREDVHTQSIDSHWTQLKRGIRDSYVSVSRHHLQRYVNEFVFFKNTRYLRHSKKFLLALYLMNRTVKYKDIVMKGRESYGPDAKLTGKKRGRVRELHYVKKENNIKQEP